MASVMARCTDEGLPDPRLHARDLAPGPVSGEAWFLWANLYGLLVPSVAAIVVGAYRAVRDLYR